MSRNTHKDNCFYVECACLFDRHIFVNSGFISDLAEYIVALWYSYYLLDEYLNALNVIISIWGNIYDDDQLKPDYSFLNSYDLASLSNNAGVLLFLIGDYKHSLSMFNDAANLINDMPITFHIGEVLFNLSLVSLLIDDHKNAQYYIDEALEIVENFQSRSMEILGARYKVLKAYILVNIGAICDAKAIIKPSLDYLRQEIVENHEYIMEAHFVFALIFLHNSELASAQRCAMSAYNIAKRIRTPMRTRARISQLLGEILFYLPDYVESRRFLYHACSQARYFSEEIVDWMYKAREECSKKIEFE